MSTDHHTPLIITCHVLDNAGAVVSRQQLEESAQSALDAVCRSEAQTYDQFMAGFTYLTQEDLRKAELSKVKKDIRSGGDIVNAPAVDGVATAGMRDADAIVAATSNDANPDTDAFEVLKKCLVYISLRSASCLLVV